MEVGAIEEPVAQAGPPNAQSAPCTPPKSSQKIQDNDEEESNEESVEFDDEDVVSPSRPESLGIGSCLANGIQLRRRPMLRVRLSLSWGKKMTTNVCCCCLMRRRLVRVRKSVVDIVLCSKVI